MRRTLPPIAAAFALSAIAVLAHHAGGAPKEPPGDSAQVSEPKITSADVAHPDLKTAFSAEVQPLLTHYCLDCHSTAKKKGKLDLERFASLDSARRDVKPWQKLVERVEASEMPPEDKPQPTADERQKLIAWTRSFLDAEAHARAGDPGPAQLRRLSNAEYDYTIRDLTGVDLQPTREFPADAAGGEGFTNAAESLSDISPALLEKYYAAAKEIAAHAVLLPDGFRFSATKTRRDWTNEIVEELRRFYHERAPADGRLPLQPYLAATIRQRDALIAGEIKLEAVAEKEKLNAKYLRVLWETLASKEASADPPLPLDEIRARWREASEKDVKAIAADIAAWQSKLWKIVLIGSYLDGNTEREVAVDPAPPNAAADAKPNSEAIAGYAEFRRCFPLVICYPQIIPNDEIICLKQFHRDDEPLTRLFLDAAGQRRLDRLWTELRFVSRWPATESEYLPLFIGFVTQTQPAAVVKYYEELREPFRKRAADFEHEVEAAAPRQLDLLLDFAARAYRRPLDDKEQRELRDLYGRLRAKEFSAEEAFRDVLARVLVSPAFLFRVEHSPPGSKPSSVDDWELATRLSYFLWSSLPDEPLRKLAAAGRLHEPAVLAEETRRMLKDPRVRGLAIEFGTQWIHVRGFDQLREKNETLFPEFDDKLRAAIYEEAIRFFQDMFQNDAVARQLLDSDYTFLNETLAKHYGIPNVAGPQWRRVEGVKQFGRGGLLGLAAVQAKESGASRTSPTLRGNWIVETLLGEKLPRPPPNVPKLPETETGNDGLSMRQLVQRHTQDAACAVCHQRIDPFGFALEKYDAIGRLREKDLGGLAVDAHATLRDGTEFDGIDGLRNYLLTKKRDVVNRLFCRRLVGYALGRAVILSDQPLIDAMSAELSKNDGRLSAAILLIVQSPQFRLIRGREFTNGD